MFENIGSKIKGLASFMCWIGIGVSIIGGIIMWNTDDLIGWGFVTMIVGSFFSWISSVLLRGFGELVENSAIIAGKDIKREIDKATKTTKVAEEKIEKLNSLKNNGCITEEEYNKKKSELLENDDEK